MYLWCAQSIPENFLVSQDKPTRQRRKGPAILETINNDDDDHTVVVMMIMMMMTVNNGKISQQNLSKTGSGTVA